MSDVRIQSCFSYQEHVHLLPERIVVGDGRRTLTSEVVRDESVEERRQFHQLRRLVLPERVFDLLQCLETFRYLRLRDLSQRHLLHVFDR